MVTLALFKAHQAVPMQWWTFKGDGPVSVGRSLSNHVVVRNSHVSRRHFELRPIYGTNQPLRWKIVSHGKNGTFLNGQPVSEAILPDDATLQLAPKGPVMKVYLRDDHQVSHPVSHPVSPLGQSPEQAPKPPRDPAPKPPRDLAPKQSPAPDNIITDLSQPAAGEPGDQARQRSIRPPQANCSHAGNQVGNLLCVHCGRPLRVIRSVRQYQLLRLLAQGGMGTTFLAWRSPEGELQPGQADPLQPGQRLVVVKQLNSEMANVPKAQELFEREAKVLQQMDHPGIPRFLDSFREDDRSYLIMELVHGQNLEQYLVQTGPVPVAQVLQWMQQVCGVLHHLHSQRPAILHRDIKPANLLRQYRDGSIVVVDFGAVKSLAGAMGTCIAAEGYSAPEQEAGRPCVASDLFSVGATMLFLLSRRSPLSFYSGPMGAMGPGELRLGELEGVTPMLRALIHRLLAVKAGDRPSSALEVKLALAACLDDYS